MKIEIRDLNFLLGRLGFRIDTICYIILNMMSHICMSFLKVCVKSMRSKQKTRVAL